MFIPNADETNLKAVTKNSVVTEVYGKLNLLNLTRVLLPNVGMSVKFYLHNPDFYIIEGFSGSKTTDSMLKIHSASLYVRHVEASSDIMVAHAKMLASNKPAIYEYKRGEVFTQHIAKGTSNIHINNFYQGRRPSLIVFGMVKNDAYAGDKTKNPFLIEPFNLRMFSFLINGSSRPSNGYDVQMDKTHDCVAHLFSKQFENLGYHNSMHSNMITKANYKTHFLILEDLTRFNTSLSDVLDPSESVTIGVNATLSAVLDSAITCILYVLLPTRFEISATGQVQSIY